MTQEFVPYEQALKLKQLGFDEPCLAVYFNATKALYFDKYINEFNKDVRTLAPLYQQAFRWFREKYKLKSWVQEHTIDTFIYEIRPHNLTDYKEGEGYVYDTHEEVELACLNKLIEIVESNTKEK